MSGHDPTLEYAEDHIPVGVGGLTRHTSRVPLRGGVSLGLTPGRPYVTRPSPDSCPRPGPGSAERRTSPEAHSRYILRSMTRDA